MSLSNILQRKRVFEHQYFSYADTLEMEFQSASMAKNSLSVTSLLRHGMASLQSSVRTSLCGRLSTRLNKQLNANLLKEKAFTA